MKVLAKFKNKGYERDIYRYTKAIIRSRWVVKTKGALGGHQLGKARSEE